ncbi:condensation domain-containing protein, partial [Chitinophaga varians]|uniref:condensation domain-containing protein n=1 Tax=Chitinophaga varians TaxID=2202339 RepID=UPI0019896467
AGRTLIDHLLVFENYPLEDRVENMMSGDTVGFTIELKDIFEQTNYDLTVVVLPGEQIKIRLNYNENVYRPEIMKAVAVHLDTILQHMVVNPGIVIPAVDMMPAAE